MQQQAPTPQQELSNFSFRRISRSGSRRGWSIILFPIQEGGYQLGTDVQLTDQANTWGEGKRRPPLARSAHFLMYVHQRETYLEKYQPSIWSGLLGLTHSQILTEVTVCTDEITKQTLHVYSIKKIN